MRPEKEDRNQTWMAGGHVMEWRVFVTLFIAVMAFISAWMFSGIDEARNDISGLSDKYVTRPDFNCAVDKLEKSLDARFTSLDQKVDETNRYLRDKGK